MTLSEKKRVIKCRDESGFTLVEIIVSTAIFAIVVSSMLALFNYTLQINRRVQALRETSQGTRTFTEVITREVRNGRIDYNSFASECAVSNYESSTNQSLGLITQTGDQLCFYVTNELFMLKRRSPQGISTAALFNSDRFRLLPGSFRMYVYPKTDPNPGAAPYPAIQPFVTIVAQFQVTGVDATPSTINYQTTISTDVYDIPSQS